MNDKKKELIKYKLWMFVFPLVLLFILFAVFLTKIGPETITSSSIDPGLLCNNDPAATVNNPPDAVNCTAVEEQDSQTTTINVLANDNYMPYPSEIPTIIAPIPATSGGPLSDNDTSNTTVTSTNTPPYISNIIDQTISEDTCTEALAFVVEDVETPAENLFLQGTSSNTTLVPNNRISIVGSGANRTITITPVVNRYGTATITIIVSDGLLNTSESFILTVLVDKSRSQTQDIRIYLKNAAITGPPINYFPPNNDPWHLVLTGLYDDHTPGINLSLHVIWSDDSEDIYIERDEGVQAFFNVPQIGSLVPKAGTYAQIGGATCGGELVISAGPTPPVPEAPVIVLLAFGLAGIGALIFLKKAGFAPRKSE